MIQYLYVAEAEQFTAASFPAMASWRLAAFLDRSWILWKEVHEMKRRLCFLLLICLLPIGALAEVRRGDSGEEVYEIQQLLFETGFLFEEPDGQFGKNTQSAVKWFQETWNLPVTGIVTDEDRMAMYDCWNGLFNPDGTLAEGELPDDQLEPQPLSPDIEGDAPVCCIRYTEADGDEHIEYCGLHAAIAESADLAYLTGTQPETPVNQQWEDAIRALYEEWLSASPEEDCAMIASSQATFFLWINQLRVTLNMQEDENAESIIESALRSQCVDLCAIVGNLGE